MGRKLKIEALTPITRVDYDPSSGAVRYRTAKGAHLGLDALQWIALLSQHIPNRGQHLRHYFGYYSNAARGQRNQLAAALAQPGQPRGDSTGAAQALTAVNPAEADHDTQDFRRECRRTWARLIRRVCETDPLICPDCGGRFQVIAFIDAPATIRKILAHLHLWDRPAPPPPAPLLGTKMSQLLPGSQPDREPENLLSLALALPRRRPHLCRLSPNPRPLLAAPITHSFGPNAAVFSLQPAIPPSIAFEPDSTPPL